jgi:hypothetical protein
MVNKKTDESSDESIGSSTATKVGQLIERYNLGKEYGAELEMLWTADGDERMSLRTLADRFNKQILETAMKDAGMFALDGEINNLYRLLSNDEVSSGKQAEARNRLEREGINVEQLEKNFVTYQAIRSYLQNEREAEYSERSDSDRLTGAIESIQRLKSRTDSVAEGTLSRLRNAGIIVLGDFRIFVDINVHCEGCDTQFGVVELLRNQGCNCNK